MNEKLSVTLASNVSYVYGTVNGVSADFYLSAPNTWTTIVPMAENGIYVVEITAYNNLGTPSIYKTTLYTSTGWLNPKLDWTEDDFYNFEDLNRVENNTLFIVDLLKKFGVIITIESFTDRDLKSIEFADSLNRIEINIEKLSKRYKPNEWIPSKTDWKANASFDFNDANRLEQNLNTLYQHYKGNYDLIPVCGAFTCGEDVI